MSTNLEQFKIKKLAVWQMMHILPKQVSTRLNYLVNISVPFHFLIVVHA